MKENCGECNRPLSSLCLTRKECTTHQSECFGCLTCSISEEQQTFIQRCVICQRICFARQSYYCAYCGGYLCRFEFINIELTEDQIDMTCGHQETKSNIYSFMSDICCKCGRKLKDNPVGSLGFCGPCSGIEVKKHQQIHMNEEETIKMNLPSEIEEKNGLLLQFLKNDRMALKKKLWFSEQTRKAAKVKVMDIERDKQCPICFQRYHLKKRRPFMVCLKQHLICEFCILNEPSIKQCPLCRDPIERKKIGPSRERIKTLELQVILTEKYRYMLQHFKYYNKKNLQIHRASISELKPPQPKVEHKESQTGRPFQPQEAFFIIQPFEVTYKRRLEVEALTNGRKRCQH